MSKEDNELELILEMVKNYGHISNKPHMTPKQAKAKIQALYAPNSEVAERAKLKEEK